MRAELVLTCPGAAPLSPQTPLKLGRGRGLSVPHSGLPRGCFPASSQALEAHGKWGWVEGRGGGSVQRLPWESTGP